MKKWNERQKKRVYKIIINWFLLLILLLLLVPLLILRSILSLIYFSFFLLFLIQTNRRYTVWMNIKVESCHVAKVESISRLIHSHLLPPPPFKVVIPFHSVLPTIFSHYMSDNIADGRTTWWIKGEEDEDLPQLLWRGSVGKSLMKLC